MQLSRLLGLVVSATLITSTAHAAIDDADASGTVDCHYSVTGTIDSEEFQFKKHDVITMKRTEANTYDINVVSTTIGGTDQHSYRLPIKQHNSMWEIEYPDVDDVKMKLQFNKYNWVQLFASFDDAPFVNLLNGTDHFDNVPVQYKGHCNFTPAH